MKELVKHTHQVLRSQWQKVAVFELIYRMVTAPAYFQLINQGIRFSLKMTGYSYLTIGNIGYFLISPWTILSILVVGSIGLLFLTFEISVLITAFQGAACYRTLSLSEMIFGGIQKLWDEIGRKNWKLFPLVLAGAFLSDLFLLYRIFSHVKPINFVISELFQQWWGVWFILALIVILSLVAVPGMFLLHKCMIEQKGFYDGYTQSWEMVKSNFISSIGTVAGFHLGLILIFVLIYVLSVVIAAVFVVLFTEHSLALAVLPEVCDKIEIILLMICSMFLPVIMTAATTVQYYEFGSTTYEPSWDFIGKYGKKAGKKGIIAAMVFISAFSIFFIYDMVRNGSFVADSIWTEVQISAHRGSSQTAPENTISAILAAMEEKADYVEIDVQETADGAVVLFHDNSLRRVAGVSGSVRGYTYEQLQMLDAGEWFSPEYAGEKIPLLEEVMQLCKGRIKLNIEIKNVGKDSQLPDKVVSFIQEFEMVQQCIVTSTRLSYLKKIKELNAEIKTGYIISAAYGDYYSSEFVDVISIRSSFVSRGMVEAAHEKGKAVHAWTVNDKSEMERMKLLGVDNIITDRPVLAREIVYRKEATESLLEYIRLVFR